MQTKEQRHATKIGALLLLAWVSFVGLTSCGGAGQAPAVKPSPEDPKLHPAVLPAYATLDVLGNQKLARRLAIELNDSLNFESLEATLTSAGVNAGVGAALASARFAGAVSAFVGRAAGVEAGGITDLDVMAASDPGLSVSLTNQMRFSIAAEPALTVEKMFADPSSTFGDLFAGSATVMSPVVATLWGLTGPPTWPGRSEITTIYADGRPGLGVFSSQGFIASADILGGSVDHPGSRAGSRVIEQLRCVSLSHFGAHDFSAIDGASITAGGLVSLQSTSVACAGCHNGISAAGDFLLGFGRRGGINNYKSYDASAGGGWPSAWFGRSVSSWTSLSSVLASDEAVQGCLTQRVFEVVAQRPANYGRDIPPMTSISARLAETGFKLADWFLAIFQSPAITSGPTLTASNVSNLEGLVAKARWVEPRKMLRALAEAAPLAAADMDTIALGIEPDEFPGAGNSGRFVLPLGYATEITRISEAAALAIVTREFALGVGQSQRAVFSGVVDPATLTSDEAETEAARIWKKWIGEGPSAVRKSALGDHYDFAYGSSLSATAAGRAQDALKALLASILISPYFLTY